MGVPKISCKLLLFIYYVINKTKKKNSKCFASYFVTNSTYLTD